jgi:hypothetical protein
MLEEDIEHIPGAIVGDIGPHAVCSPRPQKLMP